MIVFTVMYPNEPGLRFDMDYYRDTHLALVKEKVSDALKAVSVERGLSGGQPGSSPDYAVICRLQFDSLDDVQAHMAPHSPVLDADIRNFTNVMPRFQINEVVF
jgi:uncharacterized protein (TIGR02118 family)